MLVLQIKGEVMYAYDHMNMFHGTGMIFWLVLLVIIVLFTMNFFKKKEDLDKRDSALDILKTRYAKGEVSKEEFEQVKKDIS